MKNMEYDISIHKGRFESIEDSTIMVRVFLRQLQRVKEQKTLYQLTLYIGELSGYLGMLATAGVIEEDDIKKLGKR